MRRTKITNIVVGGPEDFNGNPDSNDGAGTLVNHKITVTFEIVVGRHVGACERCGCKTPPPTTAQLLDLGVAYLVGMDGRYIAAWHRDDHGSGHYLPATWGAVDGKLLCGGCLPQVQAALRSAMAVAQ